jgi:hypothetical protein
LEKSHCITVTLPSFTQEKLLFAQTIKEFHAFCGERKFFNLFKVARHWTLTYIFQCQHNRRSKQEKQEDEEQKEAPIANLLDNPCSFRIRPISATFVDIIMLCMKTTGFNPGLYVHSVQPETLLLRKLRFYWVSETCESINHTNFQALL